MSTVHEALPTHTTVSSVSGSHLHSASIGLLPRASKQCSGEPVLTVCTTHVTRVCVSHTVSTVPSPQITERSRAHFTHDTSGICTPRTVPSVPSSVMLPETTTMVAPHSPPPLIPLTVYNAAWSSTNTERNAHVQATDYNRPASSMTPYSSFGFEPMQAAGHAMPAPSLYPYSGFGFNPSTSSCRTTPLSVSSAGTHVQLVDPSLMPSVVSHPYITPVCRMHMRIGCSSKSGQSSSQDHQHLGYYGPPVVLLAKPYKQTAEGRMQLLPSSQQIA